MEQQIEVEAAAAGPSRTVAGLTAAATTAAVASRDEMLHVETPAEAEQQSRDGGAQAPCETSSLQHAAASCAAFSTAIEPRSVLSASEQQAAASADHHCHHHHHQQQQQQQQQQQSDGAAGPADGAQQHERDTCSSDQMASLDQSNSTDQSDLQPGQAETGAEKLLTDAADDGSIPPAAAAAAAAGQALKHTDDVGGQAGATQDDVAARDNMCMVDGCDADLSTMKPYFRRSKICPAHQMAAMVLVNKEESRFCQQCTKCHPMAEFDGVKRSCRSQLLHHNKSRKHRRRCTPGSFYSSKRVRNPNGVAKKKAAAPPNPAAAARTSAAKAAAAAAKAAKAAQQAAAKAATAAAAARAVETFGPEAGRSDRSAAAAAAAAAGSNTICMWSMCAAAVGDSAAAAAMPGYNPCISSSGGRSRIDDGMQYDYSAAAAGQRRASMQRYPLLQQYSADSADFAAAAAPRGDLGSQALLQGFRSLPNYFNPNSLGLSNAAQGLTPISEAGVLCQPCSGPGYGMTVSPVGQRASHPGFDSQALLPSSGVPPAATRYNLGVLPSSRTPSMTGAMMDHAAVHIKNEDELIPSSSSCSSKGSPHMPPAAFHAERMANASYQQQQQQQPMPWFQQQQQLSWQQHEQQPPNWLQLEGEAHWRQQQQQQQMHGVRGSQLASAGVHGLGGSRGDLSDWFAAVPAQRQQQQQQLHKRPHQQQLPQQPLSFPRLDTLSSYDSGLDAWASLQLPQQQKQQQQEKQQQQVKLDPFAACTTPRQQLCGSYNRLQLARHLAHQAAAAAAAQQEDQQTAATHAAAEQQQQLNAAAGPPRPGLLLERRYQQHQQQQHMQGVLMQSQQGMAMQQQQQQQDGSPNVSAGSTCAPAGFKCLPAEVHRRSLAAIMAANAAAAPFGRTVAPYEYNQQQQQQQQQRRQLAEYGLTPADVVVGVDMYCHGLTDPGWGAAAAATAAPQGSGPENLSSNPSDGTHSAGFDRQSSMTSHNAGAQGNSPAFGAANQGVNPAMAVNPHPAMAGLSTLHPNLMGLDMPALAALVGNCLDAEADDAWLLEACQAADDKVGDALMDTLGDLGF